MTVVIQRLHFLDVTLSSLIAGGGGGQYQFLEKYQPISPISIY